eukprot:scaffold50639_cov67-Phaeocystis_antarctica.AAC.4
MVVSLAPSETGGRGQTAPAQPRSSERTSQEVMAPNENEVRWIPNCVVEIKTQPKAQPATGVIKIQQKAALRCVGRPPTVAAGRACSTKW